jgi:hypothetical protein
MSYFAGDEPNVAFVENEERVRPGAGVKPKEGG